MSLRNNPGQILGTAPVFWRRASPAPSLCMRMRKKVEVQRSVLMVTEQRNQIVNCCNHCERSKRWRKRSSACRMRDCKLMRIKERKGVLSSSLTYKVDVYITKDLIVTRMENLSSEIIQRFHSPDMLPPKFAIPNWSKSDTRVSSSVYWKIWGFLGKKMLKFIGQTYSVYWLGVGDVHC